MPRENRNTMTAHNSKRPSHAGQRHLSVKEASNYTGLSHSTLNKLRCSGGGPRFAKIGRRVLYDIADLDSWIATHLKISTSNS